MSAEVHASARSIIFLNQSNIHSHARQAPMDSGKETSRPLHSRFLRNEGESLNPKRANSELLAAPQVHYQTKVHHGRYSELWRIGFTLRKLWILRAPTMRRNPLLLLSVLLAAFFLAPVASAHRTHRQATPAPVRASRNKRAQATHAAKRANTKVPRAKRHRLIARLRPADFTRSHRVKPESKAAETEADRSDSANNDSNESQDPPPVVETASLPSAHKPMPPPLRGSYESLVRQNEKTEDKDGLERIEDDADLNDRIARKMLVPVPVSAALNVNQNLPENRRYCRPWTARFLADLARAHAAVFHGPLEVSSAVRTVEYQKQLMKVNGNATSAEGDIASPHLTGATIDIAKNLLSRKEVAWMRAWLLPLQNVGKIDVEEEFKQSCFHITVYKSYIPTLPVRKPAVRAAASQVETAGSGL
jgi:hypothetical protein